MSEKTITFADLELQRCPFSAYATLQKEEPVYFDPVAKAYILTRYEDCRAVLKDHERFSSSTGLVMTRSNEAVNRLYSEKGWQPLDVLTSCDPPAHRHYRTLVERAFSISRVKQLNGYIEKNVNELIDAFIDKGEVEFVSAFAVALPLHVIADIVGVPRSDMSKFIRWADAAIETVDPSLSPERELALAEILIECQHYIVKKIGQLKKHPEDTLFSELVHAEIDGRGLNTRELLSIVQTLMVAGYETTTSAIASCLRFLIDDPSLAEKLYVEPEGIHQFVEETLRINAPLQGLPRRVVEDVELDGVMLPKGALVIVKFGAANRDPEQFSNPNDFDPCRANASSHVTFGFGIHFCVGNQLARSENRIAVEQITRRLKNLRYAQGEKSWEHKDSFVTWGPKKFDIAFDRR